MSPVGVSSIYHKFDYENYIATSVLKIFYEKRFPPSSAFKFLSIYADLLLDINMNNYFKDSWMKKDEVISFLYRKFGIYLKNSLVVF